jgi:PAS domain S-box-containing protein
MRKRTRTALEKSAPFSRAILNSLRDHVAVLDAQGMIIAVNEAWEKFAAQNGAPDMPRVSVGANYVDVCRQAVKAGNQSTGQALIGVESVLNGTKDQFDMDYECSSPLQERWFKMTVLRQKKPASGVVIIHSDITDRKQGEDALRRSEKRLRLLTDALPVLIAYVDANQRYGFNNKGYEDWFGHPRKYVEGKHLRQVLGEKAYQAIRPRVEAALSGNLVTFEDFIPYRGAGRRYVHVTYVPDRQDGRVRGFFALIQDLTARKQAEEEIRESRDKLSTIITGADVGTWDWNVQTGTVHVNDRFCTMLGYKPGTFGTDVRRFFESLHPDDAERVNGLVESHFAGESEFYRCDFRLRLASGSYKWIHDAGRLIERDHEGRPLRMVGIHLDINDLKLADEALKAREEEFRSMFELAAVGNAQADPESGRFTRVNRKFCDITGYTEEELLNMTYRDITYPEDRARDTAEIQKVVKGEAGTWSTEKRYTRKDGKIIWVSTNGTVMRLDSKPHRTVASIVDITERKSYEDALRAHRQALRTLAAEISQTQEKERRQIADDLHDRIGQNLLLAKMKLGELSAVLPVQHSASIEQVRTLLDQIIKDTRSLIRDLCPQVLYELGLEAAVDWLVEQTQAKYGLSCVAEITPLRKPIREDRRIILFQAARELLVNVAKHARAKQAKVILQGDEARVRIQVVDDGCGFDPSFVTLPTRGFGLFSIRERVELLGGELQIDSAPGQGTRATVTVPTWGG